MMELLFVEVKTMDINNKEGLTPEDNWTKSKQRKFKRGVELYLSKHKLWNDEIKIRLDLFCVYLNSKENTHTHKVYENVIIE